MKEQGTKQRFRTQIEATEGGNDRGTWDMLLLSSFFLSQGCWILNKMDLFDLIKWHKRFIWTDAEFLR